MTRTILAWPQVAVFGLLASIGMLMSVPSRAAEVYHTSSIKWVYPLADGSFVLTFTIDSAGCPASGSPKYQFVRVNENSVTEEGSRKIYAAAMLALAMGRQVDIAFSDTTTNCYINRLIVREQ